MEFKQIDINTIVVDGITYIAVEQLGCVGCALSHEPGCLAVICSEIARSDNRSVIWKRKTTDVQNKSSSEHTKPINIKVVNENKIIIDGVEYQPTDNKYGCTGCAFRGEICREYYHKMPCIAAERTDSRRVIWKKVSDKQIHVPVLEIRQTKKKIYKLNFKS